MLFKEGDWFLPSCYNFVSGSPFGVSQWPWDFTERLWEEALSGEKKSCHRPL